jgi:WD40 repeat protein
MWDTRSNKLLQHYSAHSAGVNAISFHSSGNYLLSASDDATLKIWDLREGQLLFTLHGHESSATAAAFSTYGSCFASGAKDKIVMVWNSGLNVDQGGHTEHDQGAQEYFSRSVGSATSASASMAARPSTASTTDITLLSKSLGQWFSTKSSPRICNGQRILCVLYMFMDVDQAHQQTKQPCRSVGRQSQVSSFVGGS